MSFHEKSAWVCLGSILFVYIPYFFVVFRHPMAFVGLFAVAAVVLVLVLSVFHICNAVATRSIRRTGDVPPRDELDSVIELRASKYSGLVLGLVVMLWSLMAMFGTPALGVREIVEANLAGDAVTSEQLAIPVAQAIFWVHLLFAGFVFANAVYYAGIVAGYRRLAYG